MVLLDAGVSASWAVAATAANLVGTAIVRAPWVRRSVAVPVVLRSVTAFDRGLVASMGAGYLLLVVWMVSPALAFADRPLVAAAFAPGLALMAAGLYLLHRAHRDLGTNWSNTLEIREGHRLVTAGIYARIRHPMYLAFLVSAAGQALAIPNWIAGPAHLAAVVLLVAGRIGPEERLLADRFGPGYERYAARTARLVPGMW